MSFFRHLFDRRDANNNSKTLLYIYKTNPIISSSISCFLFEMYKFWNGVQVTSLTWQIPSLFDPHMTLWGKMKIPNHYCISARHAKSYSWVSIVYSWKSRCSSSGKLSKLSKSHFEPNYLWVRSMQVCSNEGPSHFSRRDNNEIAKIT